MERSKALRVLREYDYWLSAYEFRGAGHPDNVAYVEAKYKAVRRRMLARLMGEQS